MRGQARTWVLAAAAVMVLGAGPAWAADEGAAALAAMAEEGHKLFTSESFGGSGTCETCHLQGGLSEGQLPNGQKIPSLKGAAAGFPRYVPRRHQVVTLTTQIANCIKGALHGTPPAYDSREMTALETYLASISKGAEMGKQFGP
jgi:thiosulfate dehydrogenase